MGRCGAASSRGSRPHSARSAARPPLFWAVIIALALLTAAVVRALLYLWRARTAHAARGRVDGNRGLAHLAATRGPQRSSSRPAATSPPLRTHCTRLCSTPARVRISCALHPSKTAGDYVREVRRQAVADLSGLSRLRTRVRVRDLRTRRVQPRALRASSLARPANRESEWLNAAAIAGLGRASYFPRSRLCCSSRRSSHPWPMKCPGDFSARARAPSTARMAFALISTGSAGTPASASCPSQARSTAIPSTSFSARRSSRALRRCTCCSRRCGGERRPSSYRREAA